MAHVAPCGPVAFVQAVQLVRPLVLIELYDTNAYTMISLFVIKKMAVNDVKCNPSTV